MLELAFQNGEVIQLLRERGCAIMNEEWEEQRKLESKLNELKTEKFEKLSNPCHIFVTFECEEGNQRALSYNS